MPLLVKDANTAVQSLSTQTDAAANLVPMHVPAALAGGIAAPVSAAAPLPVVNAAGAPAQDGSGMIAAGGTAQQLFGGVTPATGFLVCNNSAAALYVSDVGLAAPGGSSIQMAPGATFATPAGYRPAGPVWLYGGTSGQGFAARRW
ncbi:MAG: hypothetical protein ACREFK_12070 [Stellaceae bacterium]